MIEGLTPNTNPVGRPRVRITPEQVRELKDRGAHGAKSRKRSGIGTATAMRLFRSIDEPVLIFKMWVPKPRRTFEPCLGSLVQ